MAEEMLSMGSRALPQGTADYRDGSTGQPKAPEGAATAMTPVGSARRWSPSRAACLTLAIGLVVTAALVLTSLGLYNRDEDRLLNLRARELGLVLTAVVPSIQTPLASAAELADATGGSPQKFHTFIDSYVGPGRQFASVSLWPLGTSHLAPVTVAGSTPALAASPARIRALFARGEHTQLLNVTGLLGTANASLGYEFTTPGVKRGFAVYAESPLPKDRRSKLSSDTAFSDLNYALYLGRTSRAGDLLVTNIRRFPIGGRQASDLVPFGDSAFTLTVTPNGSLGGTFFESLPWIICGGGVLLTLAAALLTDRLAHRRRYAEQLVDVLDRVAAENRDMYTEQRSIAQTLQHALLPDKLPTFSGLEVDARYVPAASGIDVGGDWYDIVATGDGQALVMIGDVSGHGLRAATTMASLRHAALAYAAQAHSPGSVLAQLSDFVNSDPHEHFATMLCALIDVPAHQLTVASAGHMAPLLIDGTGSVGHFPEIAANVPIGVVRNSPYEEVTVSVSPNTTLIAFTDGLVERRGEIIDTGLERLRAIATSQRVPLDDLLTKLAYGLASEGHHDDTAIVGIRWQS
ncbi:MAG TPA: PP2C family protein-serine/threonine phosphatase [Solirubrobacteraceae bacterium]|jgi:serine phosphatase RsbU (regulator of sigma subunit)